MGQRDAARADLEQADAMTEIAKGTIEGLRAEVKKLKARPGNGALKARLYAAEAAQHKQAMATKAMRDERDAARAEVERLREGIREFHDNPDADGRYTALRALLDRRDDE
jgi:uncharacterized coiled-coil DUF342 family protein